MGRGRPRIDIDKSQFEKLCELQCTKVEIAGWFRVSEDTIERWCKRTYKQNFEDVFRDIRSVGKIALRRTMMQQAERNPATAIFLAKNWLGMSDKIEEKVTVRNDDETIKAMDEYFENLKNHDDKRSDP